MPSHHATIGSSCGLAAHASVSLSVEEIEQLRRPPGPSCGATFTASALKHPDEQTLAALVAIGQAAQDLAVPDDMHEWGVIAAPRYIGRSILLPNISRFHQEGAWGVSPHAVPHRSLHSLSGALSQFLQLHGPNFGVGGCPGHECEGLLAAIPLIEGLNLPGLWLVLSRIEPELPPSPAGLPHPEARAEALVLALVPATSDRARVRLQIRTDELPSGDLLTFEALIALLQQGIGTCRLGASTQLHLHPLAGLPEHSTSLVLCGATPGISTSR